MGFFFTTFYQPLANLLFFPMDVFNTTSLVFGILALTIITKIILLPLSIKNTNIQIKMGAISKDLAKIKERVKDKQEQTKQILEMYKKAKVNPFVPFLLLLIQIPIFINIFFLVKDIGEEMFSYTDTLYRGVSQIPLNFEFLFFDLTVRGGITIALLVGLTQFVLMHYSQKNITSINSPIQKMLFVVVLPIFAGGVSLFLITSVGVYWFFNNILSLLQEILILQNLRNKKALKAKHP